MLMPYRTLADPEVQGEGSIDPLGLATMSDRLAEAILPGMRARMWRPRFLTAIAVAAVTVEPIRDVLSADGISPPWLVLEWYYAEAMATLSGANGANLGRIPGIDKARQARRDAIPLNAKRYLKTPKVFGFHGVYKRLATHLDIVDDDLSLGENGHRLLKAWEREQGLVGFTDHERLEGDGPRLRKAVREAVREALESGQTERRGGWSGSALFIDHLAPHRLGNTEADLLWSLLVAGTGTPRGEIFDLLRAPDVLALAREGAGERQLLHVLRPRVSPDLGLRLDAIEAYEGVCRPLQESWDRIRYLATTQRPSLLRAHDDIRDSGLLEMVSELPRAIESGRRGLAASPITTDFEALVRTFERAETPSDLVQALWVHHQSVQQGKPPDGKRPWFEETADGALVIRPPYRLDEAARQEEFVHPYRVQSVVSFIHDLGRGA